MTLPAFLTSVAAILTADATDVQTSRRGHGSARLLTRDEHAAHAFELHATRAGLKVQRTTTDDGSLVVGLKGFSR